jgi:glyoxylase-like metal-dependent hydrolase (beta-lactamase superfamily II)
MANIPLEDGYTDIIAKAMRGLNLDDQELAAQTGLDLATLQAMRGGAFDSGIAGKIAPVLGLNASALEAVALQKFSPSPVAVEGFAQFNTPYSDYFVNSYLVWDPSTKEAVAFDTGADATEMLQFLSDKGLTLRAVFLTHTHGDHVLELDRILEKTGATAYVGDREPLEGAEGFAPGRKWQIGTLSIETRLTWGHSPGGVTYVVHGLDRPIAVVGDAVFSGSMGGGNVSYADALTTNRNEIFSLSETTVLAPGHGPLTTIGEELRYNPFFAR